jgi:hypothetical protein
VKSKKLREKSTCFASAIERRTVTSFRAAISGSKLSGAFTITMSVWSLRLSLPNVFMALR